jgi:hypothetical protein
MRASRGSTRPSSRHVAGVAGALAGALVLFLLLCAASVHSFPGDSDGATVILEGQSIAAGHLTLHGWALTVESFWTVDALIYAAVIKIIGLRPDLLHIVPALVATAVVVVAAYLARGWARGWAGMAAGITVVVLVGLPSPDLAYFLLAGPLHVGTALWCLISFAGLARGRFGWGWAVAVVFLAAGLLGDFMTVTIGVVPVALAGLVAMRRERAWRAGLAVLVAAPASIVVALLVRLVADAIGTFAIVNRAFPVSGSQIGWNLEHVPASVAALLGVGALPIGPTNGGAVWQVVHVVGVIVFLAGLLVALVDLTRDLVRPTRPARTTTSFVDVVVLCALVGDVVTFVLFSSTPDPGNVRYLTPAVIFGAILAGRALGRGVTALRSERVRRMTLLTASVVVVAFGVDVATYLSRPAPVQPVAQLTAFLERHHLTRGVGDYWSASIVTVQSSGTVTVRPVTADLLDRLHRDDRQSSVAWYAGQAFQFFVYDAAHQLPGVNARSARNKFGPSEHTYAVGTYRVVVWSHVLRFSPALPPQPDPLDIVWQL